VRVVFGGGSAVRELRGVRAPDDLEEPAFFRLQSKEGSNLRGWNFKEHTKFNVEGRNPVWSDKELNGHGRRGIRDVVMAAIHDHKSAEFAGFFFESNSRLCWEKEYGGDKHDESNDREDVAVARSERKEDERGATKPENNAEKHPDLRFAVNPRAVALRLRIGGVGSYGHRLWFFWQILFTVSGP
jgi:hypothetical protein